MELLGAGFAADAFWATCSTIKLTAKLALMPLPPLTVTVAG
jgi:hypothetical protein